MRHFILSVGLIAAIGIAPALAEQTLSQEPTRIEIDQQAKAFIFIIDDEPVAMLDKEGLKVKGDIAFEGTMTDAGTGALATTQATTEAGND